MKKPIFIFLSGCTICSWIICRVVLFPMYLIIPCIERLMNYSPESKLLELYHLAFWPFIFIFFMLIVLLIMDIVWIYLMIKSGAKIMINNKANNEQVKNSYKKDTIPG